MDGPLSLSDIHFGEYHFKLISTIKILFFYYRKAKNRAIRSQKQESVGSFARLSIKAVDCTLNFLITSKPGRKLDNLRSIKLVNISVNN